MTDQELVVSTLRQVRIIVAGAATGAFDISGAITRLVTLLDTQELTDAMGRLDRGYGLHVVK